MENTDRPDLLDDVHVGDLGCGSVYVRHILQLERGALEELVVELEAVVDGDIVATKRFVERIRILVILVIHMVI